MKKKRSARRASRVSTRPLPTTWRSPAAWRTSMRPMQGHRSGDARCHVQLKPTFSVDGLKAFFVCQVCDYREQRDYPGRQLELRGLT